MENPMTQRFPVAYKRIPSFLMLLIIPITSQIAFAKCDDADALALTETLQAEVKGDVKTLNKFVGRLKAIESISELDGTYGCSNCADLVGQADDVMTKITLRFLRRPSHYGTSVTQAWIEVQPDSTSPVTLKYDGPPDPDCPPGSGCAYRSLCAKKCQDPTFGGCAHPCP
jgi:hypothetical protein